MHLIESVTNMVRQIGGEGFRLRPKIGLREFIANVVLNSEIFDWRKEVELQKPHFRISKPVMVKPVSSPNKKRKKESILNMDDPLDRKIAELLQK